MRKQLTTIAIAFATAVPSALAGGLVTNTNQNAAYLRLMCQDGIIDLSGLYANPAGTAFLKPGHHFSLNLQNAKQSRNIETSFPLFALNSKNPNTTHRFEGDAYAPVIPSFHYSYNTEGKWSFNLNFALGGGGGKCEFDNGLGSFEALYAGTLYQQVPAGVNAQLSQVLPGQVAAGLVQAGVPEPYASQLAGTVSYDSKMTGYDLNAYMKGKQYYFGLSLGATYKLRDNLAVFAGARVVYAMCNYNGFVDDIKATYKYEYEVPANAALGFPGTKGEGAGELDLNSNSLDLNTDQKGFGVTPMVGIDWKINEHWNVAFKYEFKTRMRLKNKSQMNEFAASMAETNSVLGQFADGKKVAADIPSIHSFGVQYSPIQPLRFNAGFRFYGDKKATQYGNKQDLIDHNTWEASAGAEYDINKYVTVSCGYLRTQYGLSDAHMNDLSFSLSSNNIGLGFRVNVSERCALDCGYMQTFYEDRTVVTPSAAGNKTDNYERKNRVFGIGVTLSL